MAQYIDFGVLQYSSISCYNLYVCPQSPCKVLCRSYIFPPSMFLSVSTILDINYWQKGKKFINSIEIPPSIPLSMLIDGFRTRWLMKTLILGGGGDIGGGGRKVGFWRKKLVFATIFVQDCRNFSPWKKLACITGAWWEI